MVCPKPVSNQGLNLRLKDLLIESGYPQEGKRVGSGAADWIFASKDTLR